MRKSITKLFLLTLFLNVSILRAHSSVELFIFRMQKVGMRCSDITVFVDVTNKKVRACQGHANFFSFTYYNYKINDNYIGLSLRSGDAVDMTGESNNYFIISRKGRLFVCIDGKYYYDTNEYIITHEPHDAYKSFVSIYDQMSSALKSSGSRSPVATKNSDLKFSINGMTYTMVNVQGGSFTMGATSEQGNELMEKGRYFSDYRKPIHRVTLDNYYIGQTEVPQGIWEAVMGSNPSDNNDNCQLPVEKVSWYRCQEFINELNFLTGLRFRLPTEAEWEFAARGGVKSRGYKYSGSNMIDNVAWYLDNRREDWNPTYPVGTKSPNELGIYDMSGNVKEWCLDNYDEYNSTPVTNPCVRNNSRIFVIRGGDGHDADYKCVISNRWKAQGDYNGYHSVRGIEHLIGLRLALSSQ